MGLKINLGSGQRKFGEGWTNVDINPRWEPDVIADGASMPMFADGSAELIVSHHNYEHYQLGGSDSMVAECYRVLCPGGSLIVATPDLTALVHAWTHGRINDYLFCVNLYGAYNGSEVDTHKWLYTKKTLQKALRMAAPWNKVTDFDWRKIPGADIAKDFWIQAAEAIK